MTSLGGNPRVSVCCWRQEWGSLKSSLKIARSLELVPMHESVFVLILGLLPPLFSLLLHRRAERQWRSRLEPIRDRSRWQPREELPGPLPTLGDPNCAFNARSPLLRCAVNPDGPCQSCRHFRPREAAASPATAAFR